MNFAFTLDHERVRFTPEGKISVIDAIKAISETDCAHCLWEDLSREHPELLEYCDEFSFHKNGNLPVADSQGWEKIHVLLFDHLVENEKI